MVDGRRLQDNPVDTERVVIPFGIYALVAVDPTLTQGVQATYVPGGPATVNLDVTEPLSLGLIMPNRNRTCDLFDVESRAFVRNSPARFDGEHGQQTLRMLTANYGANPGVVLPGPILADVPYAAAASVRLFPLDPILYVCPNPPATFRTDARGRTLVYCGYMLPESYPGIVASVQFNSSGPVPLAEILDVSGYDPTNPTNVATRLSSMYVPAQEEGSRPMGWMIINNGEVVPTLYVIYPCFLADIDPTDLNDISDFIHRLPTGDIRAPLNRRQGVEYYDVPSLPSVVQAVNPNVFIRPSL
jgi:hypothetical protein